MGTSVPLPWIALWLSGAGKLDRIGPLAKPCFDTFEFIKPYKLTIFYHRAAAYWYATNGLQVWCGSLGRIIGDMSSPAAAQSAMSVVKRLTIRKTQTAHTKSREPRSPSLHSERHCAKQMSSTYGALEGISGGSRAP